MGHYDTCRDGYCPGCGQGERAIWACGRERCENYHEWLRRNNPQKLQELKTKIKTEDEAGEERRVTARQIKRHTLQIAEEAKRDAHS